ncbi:hypothetical protein THIOSC15_1240014 [uncultured Thiomicrorhabdus sp.]
MKRLFDLFLICISLPLLLSVFIAVAILVRIKLGAPIFFTLVHRYPLEHKGLASSQFKMADHCFSIANCYNRVNITATPIEEAQPWRFFIACKRVSYARSLL